MYVPAHALCEEVYNIRQKEFLYKRYVHGRLLIDEWHKAGGLRCWSSD